MNKFPSSLFCSCIFIFHPLIHFNFSSIIIVHPCTSGRLFLHITKYFVPCVNIIFFKNSIMLTWSHSQVHQIVIALIRLTPSMTLNQEKSSRSNVNMFHLLLVCIVWHIIPILQYKPFQTYLWFLTLKFCYNVYVIISILSSRCIWSLQNGQGSWKLKATKYCGTLR